MLIRRGGRTTTLLLVLLVIALGYGVAAKKRAKKKDKKHHSSHVQHPAPASGPTQISAATEQSSGRLPLSGPSETAQLRDIIAEYEKSNKDLVLKHNKLVQDYNTLLAAHSEVIQKFNLMVKEVRDPALSTYIASKAVQTYHHPGIEGAVNKTVLHVLPLAQHAFLKGQLKGTEWLNKTQSKVSGFLQAYGGESSQAWVPSVSGFIVYGSVLIPVSIACCCVMEFVCKLQKLIQFGHIYLALTGFSMVFFAFSTGEDPLSTFATHDWQLYEFAQVAFALVFVLYSIVSVTGLLCQSQKGNLRVLHVTVIVLFGTMYYMLVWTPAMVDELPQVDHFVESLWMPEEAAAAAPGTAAPSGKGTDDVPLLLTMTPYCLVGVVFGALFILDLSPTQDATAEEEKEAEKDAENKGD